MQHFTSSLSNNKFPVSERISAKALRGSILKEIQKEYPAFDGTGDVSVSELNHYRQVYTQQLLTREVGALTELEHKVLEKISQNHIIADEATDVKATSTRGQRWADRIASFGGSWKFIGIFGGFIIGWMILNVYWLRNQSFDPFPFILLNLILSCLAAIQAPVIMMSQNRQEEKDRERAKNDYMVNLKSELEIRMLHEKIDHLIITQQENLAEMQQVQADMLKKLIKKGN